MVFEFALLSKLLSPDVSGLRDAKDDPRLLLARAGRKAVRSERDRLLSTFGFEDTVSTVKDESQVAADSDLKIKKRKRNTLL